MSTSEFEQIFPLGETNDAYAENFIGQSYLAQLTDGGTRVGNVTFEPCCRNNWHIHHGEEGGGDQILICTAGSGWYQADGQEPVSTAPAPRSACPPARSTGTARRPTRGSRTSHSSRPVRTCTTSGLSPSRTTSTTSCRRHSSVFA